MINKSTRVTPISATLLDVAITNENDIIVTHDVVLQVIADHDLISVTINVTKPKRQPVRRTFRHLGGYCNLKLCSLLLENSHDINNILFIDDVKQAELFTEVFVRCIDSCVPIVTKKIKKPFAPWMNDDLRRAMKIRNNFQSNLKADRHNSRFQEAYKREKKRVRTLISKTKADCYHAQINNYRGNSSANWKVITGLVPGQKRNSSSFTFDTTSVKAEEFNKFFFKHR